MVTISTIITINMLFSNLMRFLVQPLFACLFVLFCLFLFFIFSFFVYVLFRYYFLFLLFL